MLFSRLLVVAFLLFAFPGCKTLDSSPGATPAASGISLSDADASAIGRKIWQNECGGTVAGLTSWNAGEDFPSLGIGHFIWYVKGRPGPFQESFPQLLAYMRQRGTAVPPWVASADGSPWSSRAEFLQARDSLRMNELRKFLANTVSVQTGFIVQRLEQALPKMESVTAGEAEKARLRENFYKMAESRTGLYALIDYVNFKGEGVKPEEKYKGAGWGLRDVLLEMGPSGGGQASADEFSEAAKRVLRRRIQNAPADRGESRWSAGWMNRCETYKRGI
ncbi:MAG: hypothetical protein GXX91_09855 [Verrucomicrobiaceae bacterium]|nr:hypothetical protein [Verrucomicrobiaceae bacterium]